MSRRATFTQAEVQRLLRAAKAEGYSCPAVDALPDGRLRLLTESQTEKQPLTPLEAWELEHGERAA